MKCTTPRVLAHHPPGHLGKPEISSGEDSNNGRHAHHHVEVTHHKVSRVQVDVDRGLREKESAHPAADEHRDESQCKISDAALIRKCDPYKLPSQISVMMVAGIVIISVGNENTNAENGFMPLRNI